MKTKEIPPVLNCAFEHRRVGRFAFDSLCVSLIGIPKKSDNRINFAEREPFSYVEC